MSRRCPVSYMIVLCSLALYGCGDELVCGAGTSERQGRCEVLTGAAPTFCAEGTKAQGNACVPDKALACGEGTKEIAGRCIADDVMITCGQGTTLMGAQCIGTSEAPQCGQSTTLMGNQCVSTSGLHIKTPLELGTTTRIIQGFHGSFSHKGLNTFAVDFDVPIGTAILAAQGGTVVGVKEDSKQGCGDPSCGQQGNFIRVDHGDGTFGVYYHLRFEGAEVSVGQQVCQGELLGYSGNTGFSTGPHLHFEITDAFNMSQPLLFEELDAASGGVPFEGASYRAQNEAPTSCELPSDEASDCAAALAMRGVILDQPLRCGQLERDKPLIIKGRAAQPNKDVMFHQYSDVRQEWLPTCVRTDARGAFEHTLLWSRQAHKTAQSWLHAALVDPGCPTWSGWETSMMLWFKD